jgi:hypothetical protein
MWIRLTPPEEGAHAQAKWPNGLYVIIIIIIIIKP